MWFRSSKVRAKFIEQYNTGGQCEWYLVPLRADSHGYYNRRERRWYWGRLASSYHQTLHEDVIALLKGNRAFQFCRFVRCNAQGEPIKMHANVNTWHREDNILSLGFLTKSEAALFKLIYKE